MSSALPSPPTTPPLNPAEPDLAARLDDLLSSYLTLLDTYTTLRAQLSAHFSSGFLSLAHANHNAASVLGAGRRFGEDAYDQRMKALRTVKILRKRAARWEREGARGEDQSSRQAKGSGGGSEVVSGKDITETAESNPIPEARQPSSAPTDTENQTDPNLHPKCEHLAFSIITVNSPNTDSSLPRDRDPLKWFTALPPPPLRQTQSRFTSAITSTIPALLTTASEMSALEAQIWDVRRDMGILDEYEAPASIRHGAENDGRTGEDSSADRSGEPVAAPNDDNGEAPMSTEASFLLSPSRKRNLVSRTRATEPRSRVLKMD